MTVSLVQDSESIPGVGSIAGQEKPVRLLTALLRNKTVPHALLFTGIEGVGKRAAASAFAMACNCLQPAAVLSSPKSEAQGARQVRSSTLPACGGCRSCRKIQKKVHPDIIDIKADGSFIKIEQVRQLCETLAMKPYQAGLRVVTISDAHTMTTSAGNALLKVLEEPPERTLLILTATQKSDLLPTIVSRCQHIRFNPIPREQLAAMLIEKQGASAGDAAIIAAMADGSFSRAFSMFENKSRVNWIHRRNWLIGEIQALPARPTGSILALAEKLAKEKELLNDSLEIVKTYLRDLLVFRYNPDRIVNRDLNPTYEHASRNATVASLLSKINLVHSAQKTIRGSFNLRLTLEVLCLNLAERCGAPRKSFELGPPENIA